VNPIGLHEFRPISLVRCMYKIISNVLANKIVLSYNLQSTINNILKGRGLMDSILISNEVVEEIKRKNKK